MDISVRTFRHIRHSEKETIQGMFSTEEGVAHVARVYAEFLSPPEYPDNGEGVDWEIVLYSYLDLKKMGFWDKISLESFFEIYGAKSSNHAHQFLSKVKVSLRYA